VRIADYFISYSNGDGVVGLDKGGVGTVLTGIVHFTEKAESHQGLCHGGSMCRCVPFCICVSIVIAN
jgi:hypothetical protein